MGTKVKFALLSMAMASGVGWYGCAGSDIITKVPGGSGGSTADGSGGTGSGSGGISGSGGSHSGSGGSGSGSGGAPATGSGGEPVGSGGAGSGTGGSASGTGGAETGSGGRASSGGATGSGGGTASGGTTGSGGGTGTGGTTPGSGGSTATGPINVLIWNNALAYGHQARAGAIQYLKARETTDNIKFDTTYAHMTATEGPSDTTFDASVFTDAGLDKYDVVFFLDTTGTTLDDSMKTARRQALQDFIEKKGRGYVGTHSATDTYQGSTWPWYVDFVGANFSNHSNAGTSGTAQYFNMMTHPILTAGKTPNPWNRKEEWYTLTRDPSKISGITILLTCHDTQMTQERPSAWIHEMPIPTGGTQAGRMFYTAFGHYTSAFMEPEVMDMIIAGIKWAAHRL